MLVASFGSRGDEEGQFHLPSGLVLDADGYLYVCDYYNDQLQLFQLYNLLIKNSPMLIFFINLVIINEVFRYWYLTMKNHMGSYNTM